MPDQNRSPSRLKLLARGAFAATFILCLLLDLSLGSHDVQAIRSFTEGVDRWQINPEFRAVAIDYSIRGSQAMSVHPAMVPAARVIIAIRSIPGLPKEFAINPTSEVHYRNFTRGPLCAYLHLCSEQDVPEFMPLVEGIGQKQDWTDADLRGFLDGFKMDFPVSKDAGALQSVGALLRDANAGRRFPIRENITALLAPHIAAIATELHLPPDPVQMSADEQQAVLERLDEYVHVHDPELWRTKQVNDFCGGIWAQVFGPPYKILLTPALVIHSVSHYMLLLMTLLLVVRISYRRRRAVSPRPAHEEQTVETPVGAGSLAPS